MYCGYLCQRKILLLLLSCSGSQSDVPVAYAGGYNRNAAAVRKSPSPQPQYMAPQAGVATPVSSPGWYNTAGGFRKSPSAVWNPYTQSYGQQPQQQQRRQPQTYSGYYGAQTARSPVASGFPKAGPYAVRRDDAKRPDAVRLSHAVVRSARKKNRLHIATTGGSVRSGIHHHRKH